MLQGLGFRAWGLGFIGFRESNDVPMSFATASPQVRVLAEGQAEKGETLNPKP